MNSSTKLAGPAIHSMVVMRGEASAWRQSARRVVRSGFGVFMALVVVVAVLTAGRTFLWCNAMQEAMASCCCRAEEPSASSPAPAHPSLRSGCCCGERTHGTLPEARATAGPIKVPTAAITLVAAVPAVSEPFVVPSEPVLLHAQAPPPSTRYGPSRASPPRASARLVSLQVFRC